MPQLMDNCVRAGLYEEVGRCPLCTSRLRRCLRPSISTSTLSPSAHAIQTFLSFRIWSVVSICVLLVLRISSVGRHGEYAGNSLAAASPDAPGSHPAAAVSTNHRSSQTAGNIHRTGDPSFIFMHRDVICTHRDAVGARLCEHSSSSAAMCGSIPSWRTQRLCRINRMRWVTAIA